MPAFRLTIALLLISISSVSAANSVTLTSPDKNIVFRLDAGQNGLVYKVTYKGKVMIENSHLSISFKNGGEFGRNVKMGKPTFQKMEETYDLIVGRSGHVHSLSNEFMMPLTETGGMK